MKDLSHARVAIRTERLGDQAAIYAVHESAFSTPQEADLVDRLRASGRLPVSLVAERDDGVAGHIAFSPVTVDDRLTSGLGLAPLAVRPEAQRQGIGSALVAAGLQQCAGRGAGFVVVLGEPEFYGKFGFVRASDHGLQNLYGVDEPFQVFEIERGVLEGLRGCVRYAPEFEALG